MKPMLATPTTGVPTSADWVHEVKWDGMRVLANVHHSHACLHTRNETDASTRFPEIVAALTAQSTPADVLLDGEVVLFDEEGSPSFKKLQNRIFVKRADTAQRLAAIAPVTFMVFDLLRFNGRDLIDEPWTVRRQLLETLTWNSDRVTVTPTFPDGEALLEATQEQGLEGIISKRIDSPYSPGKRSKAWRKLPHRPTHSMVIGGWRPETGSDNRVGSLLVGLPESSAGEATRLCFLGRVGSGVAGSAQETLMPLLREHAAKAPPFTTDLPDADAAGAHWVHPRLVIDVRALGGIPKPGYRLRQPSFQGLRPDLTPADLVTETTKSATAKTNDTPTKASEKAQPLPQQPQTMSADVEDRRVPLTNLEKVLYPDSGTTKSEIISYLVEASAALLPALAGRPVTRVRWPHGVQGPSFFEKNTPKNTPEWVQTITLHSPGSRRESAQVTYPLVDDLSTLMWLGNLAAVELHVPQWRIDSQGAPYAPDRLVIDLDPGEPAGLTECARVALIVRDVLLEQGAGVIVPVTSGSKGIQLYTPVVGDPDDRDATRSRAQQLAKTLEQTHSDLVVATMTKAKRPGKILLDWSQNTRSKTTICPYSPRGKHRHVTVAAPRTWDEIEAAATGAPAHALTQLGPREVLDRLEKLGNLFAPVHLWT
ncbi:DNA ligase D [Dermatophilus congolensis]|nr:DNA ligase D [Dermatophilus congolensis]MBO3131900.1 DNA ligase D [Dermatophilus congolensis]MBO3133943.1 DNA ligase D [Dermatophilus congolensis]MBO3136174.1 DNA ligase D [Dermatophilus congolensis]MBO3138418.1 DNA ligase D [Dermatophilus congolensis]